MNIAICGNPTQLRNFHAFPARVALMQKVEILISIQTNPHYTLASKEISKKLSFIETTYRQEFTRVHFNKIIDKIFL